VTIDLFDSCPFVTPVDSYEMAEFWV